MISGSALYASLSCQPTSPFVSLSSSTPSNSPEFPTTLCGTQKPGAESGRPRSPSPTHRSDARLAFKMNLEMRKEGTTSTSADIGDAVCGREGVSIGTPWIRLCRTHPHPREDKKYVVPSLIRHDAMPTEMSRRRAARSVPAVLNRVSTSTRKSLPISGILVTYTILGQQSGSSAA